MPCGPKLTKSKFVMIFVIQDIHKRGKEGVEILMSASVISIPKRREKINKHTSSIGNSFKIAPSFSSKVSWVNLTLRM